MPLPPTLSFPVQGAGFTLTRSYISELWWALEGNLSYTQTDNVFEFLYAPVPPYRAWIVFYENFWDWSSNHYTLDHCIQYAYDKFAPSAPENSVHLSVKYVYDTDEHRRALYVATILPSLNIKVLLPPQNAPYWAPLAEGFEE